MLSHSAWQQRNRILEWKRPVPFSLRILRMFSVKICAGSVCKRQRAAPTPHLYGEGRPLGIGWEKFGRGW